MGDVSRRTFLGAGAGTFGLIALGINESVAGATATPSVTSMTSDMSAPLRADYAPSVGRVFTARHAGHTHRVTLSRIHDLSPTSAKQRSHCFAMVFVPVGRTRLEDGIYTLRRSKAVTHKLFLSSLGSTGSMQAIINRSS
jgi:hypothetical protein